MNRRLFEYYRAQEFHPTWIGIFVNPYFLARRGLDRAVAQLAPELGGRLLDVGCGTKPYACHFAVAEYVGLDIDSPRTRAWRIADVLYEGGRFPFEAESFDSVLCNEVLEHIFEPEVFLEEMRRVLRPGGRLLLTVPFVWAEHDKPFDFARYSTFGLKALLERHGFEVLAQRKLAADVSVLFQLANDYLYKVLPESLLARRLACVIVMAPLSAAGAFLGWLLPGNPDLYLDQAVLARRA